MQLYRASEVEMVCLAYKNIVLGRENAAESQSAAAFCMTAFLKCVFLP